MDRFIKSTKGTFEKVSDLIHRQHDYVSFRCHFRCLNISPPPFCVSNFQRFFLHVPPQGVFNLNERFAGIKKMVKANNFPFDFELRLNTFDFSLAIENVVNFSFTVFCSFPTADSHPL